MYSIISYYHPHPLTLNPTFYLTCLSGYYNFSVIHFAAEALLLISLLSVKHSRFRCREVCCIMLSLCDVHVCHALHQHHYLMQTVSRDILPSLCSK